MSVVKVLGVTISNPNKVIFEAEGITKLDLVNYYRDVSRRMLRYVKGRPVALFRCHGGLGGECFFKKHPGTEGEAVRCAKINSQDYFVIDSARDIIYQVQMGSIEFHTWGCLAEAAETPNLMIFDLDPDEALPLETLRQGALKVKELLDNLRLRSSLKTSGGKGYHIMVKLSPSKSWEEVFEISKQIALLLECKYPKLFTTNIKKASRRGKIFIDYLRNKMGSSCVAAFSVRARSGAGVSMPIAWGDLYKIKPNEVTIKNYKNYLKQP